MGTVFADNEMNALNLLETLMDSLLPMRPAVLAVIPGALFFQEYEDQ